jgi:hypothetical protein
MLVVPRQTTSLPSFVKLFRVSLSVGSYPRSTQPS